MSDVTIPGRVHAGIVYGSGARFTLTVRSNGLIVHCFKDYEFLASDILRLEPDGPAMLARGVRIIHNVPGYPAKLHFSCSGGLPRIRAAMAEAGFDASKLAPGQTGFQLWHAIATVLAFCFIGNLLFGHA